MNTTIMEARIAPELATRTDLGREEVRAIAEAINPIIADSVALYIKTKNYHWHVSGPHFRDMHMLFDEQAASVLSSVDVLAERMRKLGATTIRGVAHVARLAQIVDDEDHYVPTKEMQARLLQDNLAVAKSQRAAIKVCEENDDKVTGNLLQEVLDQTERRIWFLYETLQSA